MKETFKRIKNVIKHSDLLIVVPNFRTTQARITYKDGSLFLRTKVQYPDETALINAFQNTSPFEWMRVLHNDFSNSLKLLS